MTVMMAPCMRERRRPFAGTEADLHLMRTWLTKRLTESGLSTDDMTQVAVFVVNELAENAVKHTISGRGGTYTVCYRWQTTGHLWVAVADMGTDTDAVPTPGDLDDLEAETGRGLAIVAALAESTDHDRLPDGGLRVWARIARGGGE